MSEPKKEEKKPQNIEVSIDTKRTEELVRLNEQLKRRLEEVDELDDVEVKTSDNTAIAESIKDALRQKYQDKGHTAPSLETRSELENAIAILKDLPDKMKPAGQAPMNPDYDQHTPTYDSHGNLLRKPYGSYTEMLQDLHDREAVFQDSPKGLAAKKALDDLTRKFFEDHKEHNSPVPVYQKPLPKLIQVNGLLVPEDPSEGDLQERNKAFRRRKLLERQERGSVAVTEEGGK